jgi:hypothetical protein
MRGKAALSAAILALCLLSGCVERWLQIRSEPEGAEVIIDGEVVGETPVDVEFHWYGGREITLRKGGYRTVHEIREIRAPWYQIFPFDLITDLLLPFMIRDIRQLQYQLEEEGRPEPAEKVMERGNELKKKLER